MTVFQNVTLSVQDAIFNYKKTISDHTFVKLRSFLTVYFLK